MLASEFRQRFLLLCQAQAGVVHAGDNRQAAVLVPVIDYGDKLHILFTERAAHLRHHPGQISFPGGRIEPGETGAQAALREAEEEIGLQPEQVELLGRLPLQSTSTGFTIEPWIGLLAPQAGWVLQADEVAEVFTAPLSFFEKTEPERYTIDFKIEPEQNFPFHLIAGGTNYNWQTRTADEYFYFFEDKVIWGLTARILKHFLEVIHDKVQTDKA